MMAGIKNVGHYVRSDKTMPVRTELPERRGGNRVYGDPLDSSTHYFHCNDDVSVADSKEMIHSAYFSRSKGLEGYGSCIAYSCTRYDIAHTLNSGDA